MAKLFEIIQVQGNLKKEIAALSAAEVVVKTAGNSSKEFKNKMKASNILYNASPVAKKIRRIKVD